jgi:hypothetical protein
MDKILEHCSLLTKCRQGYVWLMDQRTSTPAELLIGAGDSGR